MVRYYCSYYLCQVVNSFSFAAIERLKLADGSSPDGGFEVDRIRIPQKTPWVVFEGFQPFRNQSWSGRRPVKSFKFLDSVSSRPHIPLSLEIKKPLVVNLLDP